MSFEEFELFAFFFLPSTLGQLILDSTGESHSSSSNSFDFQIPITTAEFVYCQIAITAATDEFVYLHIVTTANEWVKGGSIVIEVAICFTHIHTGCIRHHSLNSQDLG